uniref:Uncharacterized protein n=1 Tax=Aegilops tauschii subsp. strangulata TaxID=200361 RepID=A0A453ELA0_AEGTS
QVTARAPTTDLPRRGRAMQMGRSRFFLCLIGRARSCMLL